MALDRKLYKGFATSNNSQGAHDGSNSMMRSSKPSAARCARAFFIAMMVPYFILAKMSWSLIAWTTLSPANIKNALVLDCLDDFLVGRQPANRVN